jgi:hypothetical protein
MFVYTYREEANKKVVEKVLLESHLNDPHLFVSKSVPREQFAPDVKVRDVHGGPIVY